VTRLDRLARSTRDLLNVIEEVSKRGAGFRSLKPPYARRGVLYESFKRHYGVDGDPLILVAKGTSRELNPSLRQSVVDRALERDPISATAEYLAEFRVDIEGFVRLDVVQACLGDFFEAAPASGLLLLMFRRSVGWFGR
jgi:Resolvase, N terminal domain